MTDRDDLASRRPQVASNSTDTLRNNADAPLRPDYLSSPERRRPSAAQAAGIMNDSPESPERRDGGSSNDSDGPLIESYDDLELDPDTLVVNTRNSMDTSSRPANAAMDTPAVQHNDHKELHPPGGGLHKKRNSIQIRLERTNKKGQYIISADDPAIKDVLKKGMDREAEEAGLKRKPRTRFRDVVFTRQFTAFDRQNPASAQSPFFGFFTLFWICMLLIFFQLALRNWRDYGSILGSNQVMKLMFSRDVILLGITDGVLCAACFSGVIFQQLVQKGCISWARSGWILQNLWQTAYLGAVLYWAYRRDWPWTHTIFITLHSLVFVMKQHSYAFYNGYLSSVHKRRAMLEAKLKQLEVIEPVSSPNSSVVPLGSAPFDSTTSGFDLSGNDDSLAKRRLSTGPKTSTNLRSEKSTVADVAAAIESGRPINADQMTVFSSIIRSEIDELTKELQGKADSSSKSYPHNLSISNFADYICLPTLVYELEYPRQDKINWWYVAEKTAATFGVLCVMQVISQGYIYPLVAKTAQMKDMGMTLEQRWQEFPYIVSDMLFPLLIEQLLTWYLIWECILNVLAELTSFADRGFYGDWWNSVTWDQYARDWNRPVHTFLLRHVYYSSISTFHLSRTAATFVTFLLSALVHEMCMALIFKKLRGYLFWMQLLQMPLVAVSRSKLMKGRVVLGNTIFWVGLFIGPSILMSLYLIT